jgi:hypothetical protein
MDRIRYIVESSIWAAIKGVDLLDDGSGLAVRCLRILKRPRGPRLMTGMICVSLKVE